VDVSGYGIESGHTLLQYAGGHGAQFGACALEHLGSFETGAKDHYVVRAAGRGVPAELPIRSGPPRPHTHTQ